MKTLICYIGIFVMVLASSAFGGDTVTEDSAVIFTISPNEIDMGTFYSGTEVDISATLSECDGAVLLMESESEDISLNQKGKVAGVWLNVAKVTAQNAPKVYILATTGALDKISSPETLEKLRVGTNYLRNQIELSSEKPGVNPDFNEFLRLKRENETYRTDIAIDLKPAGSGKVALSSRLPLASTIPPGVYNVVLYTFKDGELLRQDSQQLTLKRIGLTNILADLARNQPVWYGLLAIVVAMFVGILMGIIFNALPGSGH